MATPQLWPCIPGGLAELGLPHAAGVGCLQIDQGTTAVSAYYWTCEQAQPACSTEYIYNLTR